VTLLKLHADGAFPLDAEDCSKIDRFKAQDAASPHVVNVGTQTQRLCGQFGKRAQKLAAQVVDPGINPPVFRNVVTALQARAKELAGVNCAVPTIDDPVVLERLMQALEEAFREVVGDARAPAP
jgi:hypothetical protein